MSVPLYQAKSEMFRVLGHPVRIRVLELLQAGPRPVRDLLAEIDVEPSSLSQQLAVLRRAGLDVRLSHRASRLADPAGLLVLPASTTLDLGATLRFGREHGLSLRAAVDDVFDAGHFDFIGYPVPGRRFHCSAEATF